jgi:ankyrin repeat protein
MLADTRTIKRINGSVRRSLVEESTEDDLTGVPEELTGEVLDEVGIRAWGGIHPMFMGGEFLPAYMPGEVEIARICLKSTTYDVDSIRARVGAGRILYRYLDEYDGETTTRKTSRTSVRPLTLQGLLDFIFTAKHFFEVLEWNFPGELEERLNFFKGESEFYPQFHDALVEKTIEDFFSKYGSDDEESMEELFYSAPHHEIEENTSSIETIRIPGLPSWIKMASADDPIYSRGYVFGGYYSARSFKKTPEKGIVERGLFSTIRDLGWKENGIHDVIFDIIDRGDVAAMEALIKLEGSKILYSTLEYVKTNGNGIPEAYLSLPPLHAAIITGNLQITAELIKNGTDVNKKIEEDPDRNIGSTPLHLACDYFSPKIIFLLLDSGALCNTARDEGRTPLHLAALKDKNGTVIRRMINAGADVNAKDKYGWTPLSCASRNGHLDVVIALMGAGADLNAKTNDGWTLLHFASYSGHMDIVTALINIGAELNAKDVDGDTPLHLASYNGHTDVAIALINAGADVNAKTNDGYKPLHIASKEGHTDFAKALINAGADVNEKDAYSWTPLHTASWYGHADVKTALINALINAGADVNAKTNDGDTPLLIACKLGHTDFATALINAGADVNAKNDNGDTPLHETCRNKHTDVVTALINASADLNVKNNNSDTPLNIALKYDMTSVAKILREAGAVS